MKLGSIERDFILQKGAEGIKTNTIKDKLLEELGISVSAERVRQILKSAQSQSDIVKELNDNIKSKTKYEIQGDSFIFYVAGTDEYGEKITKQISVSIDLVCDIAYSFSKHGANITSEEILIKYDITPDVFQLVKNRLRIFKASNAIPGVILDMIAKKYGPEALQEKIDEVASNAVYDKYRKPLVDSYQRAKENEYKKAITTLYNIDSMIDKVKEAIIKHKPIDVDFDLVIPSDASRAEFVFGDLHIGKEGTKDILQRFNILLNDVISCPESNINIICMGDLAEILIEGGRHPGQIESMEGSTGFELMLDIVKILENFLLTIRKSGKTVSFYGKTGNHGALSDKKGGDSKFTGELIIYEMLKRGLQHTDIQIEYFKDTRNTLALGEINYILNHGHDGATSRNPLDILAHKSRFDKFNIMLFADKHHYEAADVTENSIKLIIPALAGRGVFDKKKMLSSCPGYVKIVENEFNLPEHFVKRLPNDFNY